MLTDRISIGVLHKLQDRFADLGKVTVCICRVGGELIAPPTWGSRFSEMIGTSQRGAEVFARAVRLCAEDINAKVPSLCHEGMTLHAAPIDYDGERLGVIVVGTRSPIPPPPAVIRKTASTYDIDSDELLASVGQIDPYSGGTPEAIHRFADLLADTIASLYGQSARIESQLADLRAVHELSDLLAGTVNVQRILDTTVKRVVEVMSVKAGIIRLLDERTGELVTKSVHNLSDAYLKKGPVLLSDNETDQAAFRGEAVYIADIVSDPRTRYPNEAAEAGIVSGLCVPMTFRGRTIGVMRAYTGEPHEFSEAETALLRSFASQAASAVISSRLFEEHLEAERMQRQVEAAGHIQRRMMPHTPPSRSGLAFGCVYDPTLQVGGDFYDFIELRNGGLAVCIADVVGKGIPAALMMASVRASLRAQVSCTEPIEDILTKVNRHMCRDTLASEFATLFLGILDPGGRKFTYCNAGHPPPMLLHAADRHELNAGGLVIGVEEAAPYSHETVELQTGDILVMVTDGVTEAMNFHGEEYGRQRLVASIEKHRALDAGPLSSQILWDVRRFVGLADQSDDITIVAMKAV